MALEKEIELLAEALNSDFGIEVEILGNYQVSLNRLYTAKRQDPDFDSLQISRSRKSPTHIIIAKTDRPPPVQTAPDLKENPKGEGQLYSLADLLGDD